MTCSHQNLRTTFAKPVTSQICLLKQGLLHALQCLLVTHYLRTNDGRRVPKQWQSLPMPDPIVAAIALLIPTIHLLPAFTSILPLLASNPFNTLLPGGDNGDSGLEVSSVKPLPASALELPYDPSNSSIGSVSSFPCDSAVIMGDSRT